MKNKPFIPGKTKFELEKQISELQNDIQIIDQQLTSRNIEIKDKRNMGVLNNKDFAEFNQWRNAACQAKTIKMTQLRTLKTLKKEMNVDEDEVYRKIGYYVEQNIPNGRLCKDEAGVYFIFEDDTITDYFPSVKYLCKYLKSLQDGPQTSEEWTD